MVWGGHYNNPGTADQLPTIAEALILLSLSTRTWQTSYAPSAALAATPGPIGGSNPTGNGNSTSGSGKSKGFSTGAIGGIAAALVILLLVAGFVLYRRNKNRNNVKSTKGDFGFSKEEEARHGEATPHASIDGPPRRPPPPPDSLSPALYDFEAPSSPNSNSSHPQHTPNQGHKQRLSGQSTAYTPHDSYRGTSPEMIEAHHPRPSIEGYSSHAGYSNYSTPTNPPLAVHHEGYEPQEFSPYPPHQQQPARSYSTDYSFGNNSATGSVYYPPPPGALSPPGAGTLSPPPQASRSPPGNISNYLRDETFYPYKVPAPDGNAAEVLNDGQYHDSYGMKDTASYTSDFSTRGRRPISGPQGSGYGSVYEPSVPGAPQSIPE